MEAAARRQDGGVGQVGEEDQSEARSGAAGADEIWIWLGVWAGDGSWEYRTNHGVWLRV